MKLLKQLNESIKRNPARTKVMKLLRSKVAFEQWGGNYSEDRKDHRAVKLHGVKEAKKVAELLNNVIKKNDIKGVKAQFMPSIGQYASADGVIVRFSKEEYPDENKQKYSLAKDKD